LAAEVFVSYAHKDRHRVLPWVRRLQQAGISLWIDERDIDAAHLWTGEIVEAIDACKVLMLVLSSTSAASPQVAREVSLAFEGEKRLLPVLLEPVPIPPALRYALAGLQYLELFRGEREETFRALLRALARLDVPFEADPEQPPPIPHNLPAALSRFIGRRQEIPEVKRQLATTRLLTLTGAGGCGKTRLALQVADDLLWEYPEGVWLVELGALTEGGLVTQEVAQAVGVKEEPGRKLEETLAEALRSRRLLLVLDNCEHLVGACAALAQQLLGACPGVQILATSREALGIAGETLFRVPSLAYPDAQRLPAADAQRVGMLAEYEAVELFVDRARLGQSGFTLTAANGVSVASVCQRLDGIPLAIELAAARVRVLSVEQIVSRLDDRFRLLTGGSRTTLPRQQTLRATLDWSYDLLSEPERVLLRRLAVFAGGFTLGAAEGVCAGEEIEEEEVLDLLGQLADKSLVLAEEQAGESRYRLLETIQRYGAEKLAASGEEAALRGRHRDRYLSLAEQAEPDLRGPRQGKWLTRLEAEHENLRAALLWTSERGEGEAGLRLGAALWWFWYVRGYLTEGRERLATVLAVAGSEAARATRARALNGAGVLAYGQGECEAARALHEESLAIKREIGDQRGIASSLNNLGSVAFNQGEYEAARALHEESLAIEREIGDQQGIALSLNNLGLMAKEQGDYAAARALYEESLAIFREIGDQQGVAYNLEGLAAVVAALGQPGRAARLFGAAEALRAAIGAPLAPNEQAEYDRDVAVARAALDEAAFAAAWAQGRALSLEQAITLALGDTGAD
jgi:predicted ATPase